MLPFNVNEYDRFSYDTETTGLLYPRDRAFLFSVSFPDGRDFAIDLRTDKAAVREFNRQLRQYRGTVIFHNASFDFRMSDSAGIVFKLVEGQIHDTVIRAACIDEHLFSYGLDDLAKRYLGAEKETEIYTELAGIFGGRATRNVQMPNISQAPYEIVAPYAKKDTRLTLDLWDWQQGEIERQGIQQIVDFETRLIPLFIRTEMQGIRVDLDYAEQAQAPIAEIINEKQKFLDREVGYDLNVNSSPQIKEMYAPIKKDGEWYSKEGILLGKTKTGNASIDAVVLRDMADKGDKKANLILELRSLIKTKDTFLGQHVLGHAFGGRVYPNINQSKGEEGGTGTGRLSMSEPAMQQIPNRNKKIAAIIKPCFLPDEGCVWVDADMASFEVRIFAHLVAAYNDELARIYAENPNMDFHQWVADTMGIVRNASYSGEVNAKQLNLSMIFNSGNGAIADKLGLPWNWESFKNRQGEVITYKKAGQEAMNAINNYHRNIIGVKKLAEHCKKVAEQRGYIKTYTGRRLRFPRGFKSYKASGLLIQSTAADRNKENWQIISEALGDQGRLMLNTHDSYSMSMPENWQPLYKKVEEAVQDSNFRVPLLLDWNGAGCNWWEALQGENRAILR